MPVGSTVSLPAGGGKKRGGFSVQVNDVTCPWVRERLITLLLYCMWVSGQAWVKVAGKKGQSLDITVFPV